MYLVQQEKIAKLFKIKVCLLYKDRLLLNFTEYRLDYHLITLWASPLMVITY